MEELIKQMDKVHLHNTAIVEQAEKSINSLRDSVERFCTSDIISETNPQFKELEKMFSDIDEFAFLRSGILVEEQF